MWSIPELLELDDILNGFRNGRRPQLQTFRELIGDLDNKCTYALEEQGDAGHLPEDIGPEPVEDAWFFKDFDVFLDSAVGTLRSGSHFLDGVVTYRPSRNFIDQTRIFLDRHVLCKTGSIENMRALGDIVAIL